MSKLLLDNLEIKNFRPFKDLKIERLGRVNLIVGKNNVGKTSLLEALWVYSKGGFRDFIWSLLEKRDEIKQGSIGAESEAEDLFVATLNLFHGRRNGKTSEPKEAIKIGPINRPDATLSINIRWEQEKQGNGTEPEISPLASPQIFTKFGRKWQAAYQFNREFLHYSPSFRNNLFQYESLFLDSNGLNDTTLAQLWDLIALTNSEDDVLKALSIIEEVERINFVSDKRSKGDRFCIVKVRNFSNPVPIHSLGEGMNRLLGLALALVNTKDGMLLIDDFDTGLHYSVLKDVWSQVFEIAKQLNIQVLATTHSWDCVEAFQQAAQEDQNEEALLIRLENRNGEITSTIFDEKRLAIAARDQIEVR